jgi:hypothetical protein
MHSEPEVYGSLCSLQMKGCSSLSTPQRASVRQEKRLLSTSLHELATSDDGRGLQGVRRILRSKENSSVKWEPTAIKVSLDPSSPARHDLFVKTAVRTRKLRQPHDPVMRRTRPRHASAADGEGLERRTRPASCPTSMFGETRKRSVEGATIFDLSAIIRQTPDRLLTSLADRMAYKVVSEFTAGTDVWDEILDVPSIEEIETTETEVSTCSEQSSKIASALTKDDSWYFHPDNLKTWAPGWKLERQIGLFIQDCERAFPQATRVAFINDPSLGIANGRLQEVGRHDPLALVFAESCAFRACVVRVMFDPPPIPDSAGRALEPDFMPDPLDYRGANSEDKSRLLRDMLQRIMVYQVTIERSAVPTFFCYYIGDVIKHWLNMLSLVSVFPDIVSGGSLPSWVKEDHRDIDIDGSEEQYDRSQWQSWKEIMRRIGWPEDVDGSIT